VDDVLRIGKSELPAFLREHLHVHSVQRKIHCAVGQNPFRHAETQVPRHQWAGQFDHEIVELVPMFAGHLQDVPETLGGQQRGGGYSRGGARPGQRAARAAEGLVLDVDFCFVEVGGDGMTPTPELAVAMTEETRRRVLATIQKLGYVPNAHASSLRSRRSTTIGVIVTNIMNPFFTAVIRGIQDFVAPKGYELFICNTDDQPESESHYLSALLSRNVDGLIVTTCHPDGQLYKPLIEKGYPLVLVDRGVASFAVNPRPA